MPQTPAEALPGATPPQNGAARKGALAAIVGTVAAGLLYASIPADEGMVYVGYLDLVGVPTKCAGDTRDVVVGRRYTEDECRRSLDRQLVAHARPVLACTPALRHDGMDYARAAAVSLAYNIGTGAYCRSTVARRFNAGNPRGACDAFLAWRFAGGREIRGLKLRRQRERALCLKGLA